MKVVETIWSCTLLLFLTLDTEYFFFPCVADFGVARVLDRASIAKSFCGEFTQVLLHAVPTNGYALFPCLAQLNLLGAVALVKGFWQ